VEEFRTWYDKKRNDSGKGRQKAVMALAQQHRRHQ
jgi:hypothetical protein